MILDHIMKLYIYKALHTYNNKNFNALTEPDLEILLKVMRVQLNLDKGSIECELRITSHATSKYFVDIYHYSF